MWKVSTLDIHETVTNACRKLLQDTDVEERVKVQRAEGLFEMGRCFVEAANSVNITSDDYYLNQISQEIINDNLSNL